MPTSTSIKFAYRTIATLGFVGLNILNFTEGAQSLPFRSAHPLVAQTNNQAQTSNQADLTLLAKVIRQFLQSSTYQTEANIQVSAVTGGTTVQSSARVKTLAEYPNKFRSEVTFAQPTDSSKTITTLVVSDGTQVWIYRPDLKQFQVLKSDEFDNVEDNYWLGFANMIYSQVPADARKYIIQSEASSNEVVKAMGLELKDLQGKSQTVNQQSLYVYDYKDAKEGFTFSAAISPETALLKQLKVAGKAEGMDITITEDILQRSENPTITQSTFKFVPPAGTQKVETLSIGPL